jgi:hypothetical protein
VNPKITVEYLRTSKLELCYTAEALQELCDDANENGILATLLGLPPTDATRALSGLAYRDVLIEVSAACARRAKEYVAAYAAADAADADAAARAAANTAAHAANVRAHASDASDASAADAAAAHAAHAAYAAARAAAHAADAADAADAAYKAEIQITIRHFCHLMNWS